MRTKACEQPRDAPENSSLDCSSRPKTFAASWHAAWLVVPTMLRMAKRLLAGAMQKAMAGASARICSAQPGSSLHCSGARKDQRRAYSGRQEWRSLWTHEVGNLEAKVERDRVAVGCCFRATAVCVVCSTVMYVVPCLWFVAASHLKRVEGVDGACERARPHCRWRRAVTSLRWRLGAPMRHRRDPIHTLRRGKAREQSPPRRPEYAAVCRHASVA